MHILNLDEAEIHQLNYERFHYPCPVVQKRMHAVYLKSVFTFEHKEIADLLDRHPNTITQDIKRYISKGIEGLKQVNYGTNKSKLAEHENSIKEIFEADPPASVKEAKQRIMDLTGIERSPTQIRVFMKRIGMKFIKTGHIPAKADSEKQKKWLKDEFEPVLLLCQQDKAHLLFIDAAHFVLAPFLCCLWCFKRIFIKSPAGRKRVNVLGAINAITKQIHFTSNETFINANSIIEFLYQLRLFYFDMKPIYIVLDNARYQHCYLVRSIAGLLDIELIFLPSYSPNLNIIERLWKFVKKKCLYAKYYDSFDKFKNAILTTMQNTNSNNEYVKELKSIMTLNFQLF